MKFYQKIEQIINSQSFQCKLESISDNFFNLKQELIIRNYLVETFNNQSFTYRAFAEYPRENSKRCDFSIIAPKVLNEQPFLIELKYSYPKDANYFKYYTSTLKRDFSTRRFSSLELDTSMFVLIVPVWNKNEMQQVSNKLNVKHNLNRYMNDQNVWKENAQLMFDNEVKKSHIYSTINHTVNKPIKIEYNFFILTHKESINFPLNKE